MNWRWFLLTAAAFVLPTADVPAAPPPIQSHEADGTLEFVPTGRSRSAPRATGTSTALEVRCLRPDGRTVVRELRGRFLVQSPQRPDASLAAAAGLVHELSLPDGWHVYRTAQPDGAAAATAMTATWKGVTATAILTSRRRFHRLVPNDPLYASQWHLSSSSIAINPGSAWDATLGTGIRIGIVDDGLQTNHPDLAPNTDTALDHDWNDATPDSPEPNTAFDFHGTACAGLAAARGNNGIGITGSAPAATLVGLRLIADTVDDADEASALTWRNQDIAIYSNSWGPRDDAQTLEGPGPATLAALRSGTTNGRGGLGSVFVWAAGNGGSAGDNSNKDGYANSIHVIAVGAATSNRTAAAYSENGSNVALCAPSDGGLGITTTDLTGSSGYNNADPGASEPADLNYTGSFGGTSAATPIVAGVAALVLSTNPSLSWRDVKAVLMKSATPIESAGTWTANSAGLRFHEKLGAGLVNASAAVSLARTWQPLPPMRSESIERTSLGLPIPDNSSAGATVTFGRSGPALALEHVQLTLTATHPNRGELEVLLTSPSGMVSRLMSTHADTGANYQAWTFSSVRHWGEEANGTWTLRVADRSTLSSTVGSLQSATLTLHGSLRNQPPAITAASLPPPDAAGHSYSDQPITITGIVTSDAENDAVTTAIQWQESSDGLSWLNLAGATSATLPSALLTPGRLIRASLTPSDATAEGSPWVSEARPINRRPLQHAVRLQPYAYQSALWNPQSNSPFSRPALINEISQGASGTKEWVEILVTRDADLRGWRLADRLNLYTVFANVPLWSQVRAGTLIVIHNGADRDTALPPAQSDPATLSVIAAHNNTALFVPGNWTGLSSTNPENVNLADAAGQLIDGVSFNGNTTYTPALGSLPANRAFRFTGGSEADAESASFWLLTASAAASQVSPGLPNGGSNATMISELRSPPSFSATGLPSGLTIDPESGVVSGSVRAPAGRYGVTLRRGSNPGSPNHSFPLAVTDPATDERDDDRDGLSNLAELALGRDPVTPESGPGFLPAPDFGPLAITWQSPAGAPSLRITAEVSDNLMTWLAGPRVIRILSTTISGDIRTVVAQPIPGEESTRSFIRLRAAVVP